MSDQSQITEAEPTLDDAFKVVIQDEMQRNHGALPVRVLSHDKPRNSVTVETLIRVRIGSVAEKLPPVPDVPIRWLSNSLGHAVTVPLPRGSEGWIAPAGGDVSAWFAHGTANATDPEAGKLDLSDSIFEPGSRPFTSPLPASAFSDTDGVLSGPWQVGDNGASDFVALAAKVLTELQSFKADFDVHIHPDPISGNTGAPTAPMTPPSSVAATKLRSK